MINYEFNEFKKDVKELAKKIKKFNPDSLILISRGGLTLGHFLAQELDLRDIFTINAISYENSKKLNKIEIFNIPNLTKYKKAVLIDDISDSGETLYEIKKLLTKKYPNLNIKTATIFYKKNSKVIPDFTLKEAKEWIKFFWEN